MYKIRSILFVLTFLLPVSSIADQSWTINLQDVDPIEAVSHLDSMFNLTLVNPTARCLARPVTFVSDKVWHESEAKELISRVVQRAGCRAVIFEGNRYIVQGSVL